MTSLVPRISTSPLGHAVMGDGEIERFGLQIVCRVGREREDLLDTDVPVGVVEREVPDCPRRAYARRLVG